MIRRRKFWLLALVAPPLFLLFVAAGGWVVMRLWNWLLPSLFGLPAVTFWQALGVLALSRILFGGVGGGGHTRWRRRGEHWDALTPEDRDRLRARLRDRHGAGPSPEHPSASGR